jgi:SAM-dependent methyltransferase
MAHIEQQQFFEMVKSEFSGHFRNAKVLDVGSLDINGNNRDLFYGCEYIGIDLDDGPNVDLVTECHTAGFPLEFFDTVISGECFEHDRHFVESIKNIVRMLKSGGLFVMTCAGRNRPEHGTTRTETISSPFTTDFYQNRTEQDFTSIPEFSGMKGLFFEERNAHDLYYCGVKCQKWGKMPKIIIGLPSNGNTKTDTAMCLARLNGEFIYSRAFDLVDSARNTIVDEFLKSDCTHLLFIDSDATFPPHTVETLLKADKDIIGVNAAKHHTGNPVIIHNRDGKELDYIRKEYERVNQVGMHVCLIKREVFEKMPWPWFFRDIIHDQRKLAGEDFTFCRNADQNYGFEVWVHNRLSAEIGHIDNGTKIKTLEHVIRPQIIAANQELMKAKIQKLKAEL